MLPPRYHDWIVDLLGGTLPEEQVATCHSCVMQAGEVPEGYRFREDAKCCTYVPALPNFLVGAALRELPPGPARASLERRLAEPAVCTPHGLDVGEDERRRYQAIVAAETFGRDPGLRCPHYLSGGQCGIWRHRNGVCATWFCKHERGATSQRFWQALEALLTLVERELSHWCACQLLDHGPPPGPPGPPDDELPAWSAWLPHIDDYYRRAAALVDDLEWSEVQAIASPEFIPAAARLHAAYAALQPLPTAAPQHADLVQIRRPLVPGLVRISHRDPTRTRIVTYSDSDPLELPTEIVDLLPRFDGRPTDLVLDELAREGIVLAPELLAFLVDFEVLQPA